MILAVNKLDLLEALLHEGPCSTKTIMERTGFLSKQTVANALNELENVQRKSIDAGCRKVLVYWISDDYDPSVTARQVVPAIEALRRCENMTVKQAMRELGIKQSENTVLKAIKDWKLARLKARPIRRVSKG